MYKYTYDQSGNAYSLKGKKRTCPSCGKGTLQLYVGKDSGEPISEVVGKCDRHYNCGYDYPPKQYFADHPEELPPAKDGRRRNYTQEPPKPLVNIPKEYLEKSVIPAAKNGLCGFVDILLQMFAPSDVKRVIDLYYLGYTKYGAVIFWQIDEKGLIREGKAMQYNVQTGGREKASWATGESFWIFSTLQARKVLRHPATSTKCIFGQHLLREVNAETNVMVVESEKNAILGALAMPYYVWLAVGSCQDFGKLWKVKSILAKCRSVVVIPDADALQDWREKAKALNLPNLKVSDLCAGHAGGWDLGDIIRDKHLRHPQTFTPAQPSPTPPPPTPAPSAKAEATPTPRIIYKFGESFPQPFDYMAIYDNLQLPEDFFTERQEAAPF